MVAGFRTHKSGEDAVGWLLLGLFDFDQHPWARARREEGTRTLRNSEPYAAGRRIG